jgi:hypothetical protein
LAKVIREVSVEEFEKKTEDLEYAGWTVSSSGHVPSSDKDTGYWWAIMT